MLNGRAAGMFFAEHTVFILWFVRKVIKGDEKDVTVVQSTDNAKTRSVIV